MAQTLKEQEMKARMYTCRACLAERGKPCVTMNTGTPCAYSHADRYRQLNKDERHGEWVFVYREEK